MTDVWDFNISCEMSPGVNGSISNFITVQQQCCDDNEMPFNFPKCCHHFQLRQAQSDNNRCYPFLLYAGLIALSATFTFVQKRLLCSLHIQQEADGSDRSQTLLSTRRRGDDKEALGVKITGIQDSLKVASLLIGPHKQNRQFTDTENVQIKHKYNNKSQFQISKCCKYILSVP